MPSACASDCNTTNIKPGSAADAARRRSEHDLGTRAEAFRSAVQHMDSARATSAMLSGRDPHRPKSTRESLPCPPRKLTPHQREEALRRLAAGETQRPGHP